MKTEQERDCQKIGGGGVGLCPAVGSVYGLDRQVGVKPIFVSYKCRLPVSMAQRHGAVSRPEVSC